MRGTFRTSGAEECDAANLIVLLRTERARRSGPEHGLIRAKPVQRYLRVRSGFTVLLRCLLLRLFDGVYLLGAAALLPPLVQVLFLCAFIDTAQLIEPCLPAFRRWLIALQQCLCFLVELVGHLFWDFLKLFPGILVFPQIALCTRGTP